MALLPDASASPSNPRDRASPSGPSSSTQEVLDRASLLIQSVLSERVRLLDPDWSDEGIPNFILGGRRRTFTLDSVVAELDGLKGRGPEVQLVIAYFSLLSISPGERIRCKTQVSGLQARLLEYVVAIETRR